MKTQFSMTSRLLAAAALTLAATSAFADASADARLTDLTITLFDLNPADGIAPSVSFASGSAGTSLATALGSTQLPTYYDSAAQYGGTAFGSASAATTPNPSVGATGIVAGDPTVGSGLLSSSAFARPAGFAYGEGDAYIGNGGGSVTFTLSPDTVLVITGHATANSFADLSSPYEASQAYAYLSLEGYVAGGLQSSHSGLAELAGNNGQYPTTASGQSDLAVSFVNGSATTSATGGFLGYVSAYAQSSPPPTPPIPEPSTGALWLVGLAALGMAARRRAGRA